MIGSPRRACSRLPHWRSTLRAALLALIAATAIADAVLGVAAQDSVAGQISSKRYIVIDAATGEIFAQKGADQQVAIASLTKIFTTIQALELAPLNTVITTDESDLFGASSTTMGFGPGERFTLNDLLYGMLLPSGNDAAHAVARSLGAQPGDTPQQSVDRFVAAMNVRIADMGLRETKLVNPHGLGVPGHYSSAHDLADFARYAIGYPTFMKIIGTAEYSTPDGAYSVGNTNKLLGGVPVYVDGLIGGKTGYDDDAGYCLIEIARRGADTMIAVTLDGVAPDVWYEDNATLLEYGFAREAARIAAGKPITGPTVDFRDPDAAVIQREVTPGGSFGAPATPAPTMPSATAAPGSAPVATAVPTPKPDAANGGGTRWGIIVAAAIALLIVGAGIAVAGMRGARVGGSGSSPTDPDPP
ncbi:MAG: serine hydrolase [Thermomicrobiales bacterium]